AMRKSTNARIVMPIDLCKANTRTLAGVTPICTIDNPMTPCTMISAATSQWNARTSAPQPASVLRSCMRFLHRLLVIAFGGAIELGFDFEANRHFGTDGFRERGHAELRAIELRASGKPRDRFEPEQRRAHAVDGEIDLHRQRDAVQRELAVQCAGVLTGLGDGAAFEMRRRKFRRIQKIVSRDRSVPTLV